MPKPTPVVKIHLGIKPIIYAGIVAESETTGFSVTEIINRALYDAGYGRAAAKAAIATAEPESDDPLVILAKTSFPPNPSAENLAPPEQRQAYWEQVREIYEARRQLGMKVTDVDYQTFVKLRRRAKEGIL